MPLGSAGVNNFLALTDVSPASYAGQATKFPKVNAGETALEFAGGAHLITLLEALSAQKWNQQFNNLLKAGGFPSWSAGVDGAAHFPDGWSAEGTPTNFKQETADVGYGKFAVRITTDAVNEGQKQTLSGLKASTKYTIFGRGKATAGDTARVFSTGATINIDEETTSTSWADLIGTFTTDGSGTNVVVKLVGKASGDIVWFCGLVCVEGTIAPAFAMHHNDEHLKAIDYQDAVPANFDYGLLRMECGMANLVWSNANSLIKGVTFGTAFTKTPVTGWSGPDEATQVGFSVALDVDIYYIWNLTVNGFTLVCYDRGAGFIAGDNVMAFWWAIGVN